VPAVEILAYSGGVMRVPNWGDVAIDLTGLDAAGQIPILVDHDPTLQGIVGHGRAVVERGQLLVRGTIPPVTEAARQVVELSKAGFAFQASVGMLPERRERIEAGAAIVVNGQTVKAGSMGLTLVRAGKLKEVSLVALGADGETSVRVAASHKGKVMPETNQTNELSSFNGPETDAFNATIPDEMKPEWLRADLSDFERIEARLAAFKRNHGDAFPKFGQGMLKAAASGGLRWGDAERVILRAEVNALRLEAHYAEMPKGPGIYSSSRDGFGNDPQAVLQAALLCHLGCESVSVKMLGDQPTQRGRALRATSLTEILQAAFRLEGREPPHGREAMIRAASTAILPNLLGNVQNKILLDQWQRLPLSCLQLCKRVSAKDFKANPAIRLVGRNAMMEQLPNDGTIKHGYIMDSAATVQLATYARMYSITRQDIINDDLQALQELPKIIARGSGLKMENVFWTLVLGNAGSFFSEANGNQVDDVLALEGLGAAVTMMRKLVDEDGQPIGVEPKLLVVPPELEALADTLFASTNVTVAGTAAAVTTSPDKNAFAGKYRPLCSPYISNDKYTGNSDTQWYLFADPAMGAAAFCVALLNGAEVPTIEQENAPFDTLGLQFRGYLDFGFAQLDKQGAVKSTGEGA
jgi:phage head maturation protease